MDRTEFLSRYLAGYIAESQKLKIAYYWKRHKAWMVDLGDGTYVGLRVIPYEPAVGVYRITAKYVRGWFQPYQLQRRIKGWPSPEIRDNLVDRKDLEVSFSCENVDTVFKWFADNLKVIKTIPEWIETGFLEVGQPLDHYAWETEASNRVEVYQAKRQRMRARERREA